jgi:MoxR-like ATPase
MRSIAVALLVAVALSPTRTSAQHTDVDWKYFGVSSHREQLLLFYDAGGMERTPDGHIRVWTKGLSLKSVNRVVNAKKLPEALLDRVASKVAAG